MCKIIWIKRFQKMQRVWSEIDPGPKEPPHLSRGKAWAQPDQPADDDARPLHRGRQAGVLQPGPDHLCHTGFIFAPPLPPPPSVSNSPVFDFRRFDFRPVAGGSTQSYDKGVKGGGKKIIVKNYKYRVLSPGLATTLWLGVAGTRSVSWGVGCTELLPSSSLGGLGRGRMSTAPDNDDTKCCLVRGAIVMESWSF